jgi:diphosphate-dependent phosphofructokinase
MTADKPHDKIQELLGTETLFRIERRAYQPPLCPALAGGAGVTRPLAGFDLEVLKVATEQLPHVSQNKLVEILPAETPSQAAPRRLGIVLSGGPAPGGHNVIAGVLRPPNGPIPTISSSAFSPDPRASSSTSTRKSPRRW